MADQVVLRKETNLYDDYAIKAVDDKVTSQYAVSITPSTTVAKTATVDGTFELFKNARVSVFFQNANTATNPTLNIEETGAKPIWAYGGPLTADGNTFNWVANSTIEFVYDGEHWLVADSGAVGLISEYDSSLNQEVIFNKLTNDGAIRGIFMQNGQLYINMDYLQTGTLKLGGQNNGNGLMIVYDASGNEIGRWSNSGMTVYKGTIQGPNIKMGGGGNDYGICEIYDGDVNKIGTWDYDGILISVSDTYYARLGRLPNSANPVRWGIVCYYCGDTPYSDTCTKSVTISPHRLDVDDYTTNEHTIVGANDIVIKTGTSFTQIHATSASFAGSLTVHGTKNRIVNTNDYGERLLYCYETTSPLFGDVGEGVISEDGKCYVQIDSIFAKTVSLDKYQIFLQKYGSGDCWVSQKTSAYFVVEGTPGLKFGWEIKAKQSDFDQYRLENQYEIKDYMKQDTDYTKELIKHIENIKMEREVLS